MENVHFYFPLFDHFYIDIYTYGNAMKTIMAMLAKFRKDMDIEKRQEFVYSFFPFMFGIYPYTVLCMI